MDSGRIINIDLRDLFLFSTFRTDGSQRNRSVIIDELERFLFIDESRYSRIYFSMEALEELCFNPFSWDSDLLNAAYILFWAVRNR